MRNGPGPLGGTASGGKWYKLTEKTMSTSLARKEKKRARGDN